MKKHNLFKILALVFAFVAVLSWLIPAGAFTSGVYVSSGLKPVGLLDVFKIPYIAFSSYSVVAIYFLVVGGLYGVMNKTGVYSILVDFFAKSFKKKEFSLLVVSTVMFGLLSAFTGLNYLLFMLVPLFIAIILRNGHSKLTALLSTIGAIILGNYASLYGFNINGYLNYFFQLDVNELIFVKVALLVLSFVGINVFLYYGYKNTNDETMKDLPLHEEEKDKKKSFVPLVILFDLTMFVLLVGSYNWQYGVNVTLFNEMHADMLAFEVFGFPVISGIIGSIGAIGTWGLVEGIILILLLSVVLVWLYSVKIDDAIDGFVDGVKEMLVPTFYFLLAYVVTAFVMLYGDNFYNTIVNFLLTLGDKFNIITVIFASLFSGLIFNDFTQLVSTNFEFFTTVITDVSKYPVVALTLQTMQSLLMLILPTSALLVLGLSYLKISYVEWVKYIWKFVLGLFVLSLVIVPQAIFIDSLIAGSAIYVLFLIYIAVMVLGLVSGWKVYQKAGRKGWEFLVPLYSYIVLFEISKLPTWQVILLFIPFVNIYILIKLMLKLAESFGKSKGFAVGLMLLPIIFWPILAFDNSKYIK
jgi:uncharacterized ion transporter superfamily protein YfcC